MTLDRLIGMTMTGTRKRYSAQDERRLQSLQITGKALGYDVFLPNRRQKETMVDPNRYLIGATCFCQGVENEPQVFNLQLDEKKSCALCGTTFHRLSDGSGIGIKKVRR